MVESIQATISNVEPVEVVVYIDEDDRESTVVADRWGLKRKVGPRIRNITQCWNELVPIARGDILMQGNDDIVFRTQDWDMKVEQQFGLCPDKVLMVHGDHMGEYEGKDFGPHPFVSRKWVEVLGYFIPPYFCSDYGDTWVNEIANLIGRRRYIPIQIEHMHPLYKKAKWDDTHVERLLRHIGDKPEVLYDHKKAERVRDAEKLRAVMDQEWQ